MSEIYFTLFAGLFSRVIYDGLLCDKQEAYRGRKKGWMVKWLQLPLLIIMTCCWSARGRACTQTNPLTPAGTRWMRKRWVYA